MTLNLKILYIGFIILFLTSFNSVIANKQSEEIDLEELSSRDKWNLAEQYLLEEDYTNARDIYKQLFEDDPQSHNLAFKIGFTYLTGEEDQNIDAAIDFLNMASENVSNRYRNRNREKRAPLNTFYYLGIAYRLNQEYEKSIDALLTYKNNMTRRESKTVQGRFIEREIQSSRDAMEFVDFERMKVIQIKVAGLEDPFIRCPILCGDANRLIFTNGRFNTFPPDINYDREASDGPFDQVYMAKIDEMGNFHSPVNISQNLDIYHPYLPVTATADGSELYLVVDEGDRGQIYKSKFIDGEYQKARPVKSLNSRGWESHASIAPDGSRIYFASDRRGGYGGMDIWYADRDSDGNWKKPVNIGSEINTEFHEEMPFISNNGKELYFSSEGHVNIGGFDVFSSIYDVDNEKWRTPKNLGYPFSTIGNDMGYVIEKSPNFIFCPVNDNKRRQGIEGCDCISITEKAAPQLAQLIGSVKIENSNAPIPDNSRVMFMIVDTDSIKQDIKLSIDGTFLIKDVKPGTYDIIVYADDEFLHSSRLHVPTENTGTIDDINIYLPQNEYIVDYITMLDKGHDLDSDDFMDGIVGDKLVLRTIIFDYNSYEINTDFESDLKIVGNYLAQHSDAIIELNAHCSQIGSQSFNLKLANQRAESVKKAILSYGGNDNQIEINTHGKNNPIALGHYADSRIYNKRVEIKNIKNAEDIYSAPVFVPGYYRLDNIDYNYDSGTFFIYENELFIASIFEAILFDFDKYSIKSIHYENLNNIAAYLNTFQNAKIKLIGHTDHYGSADYNIKLSKNRAKEVEKYLLNKGVSSSQIETNWEGEEVNITVKTPNDVIRRLNRRVEIEIINPGDQPAIVAPIIVPDGYSAN